MYTTIVLSLGIFLPAAPPEVPGPVRAHGVAVTVRVTDPATNMVGSGVVLAVHEKYVYFLTAAHLVGRESKPQVETFTATPAPQVDGVYGSCEVLLWRKGPDLAVLRLPAGKRAWTTVSLAPPAPDGTSLDRGWALGCDNGKAPRLQPVPLTERKLIRRFDGEDNAFYWESPGKTVAGRSGGPLLDDQGRLIGICSGVQNDASYYAHWDEIVGSFRKNQLEWLVDERRGR